MKAESEIWQVRIQGQTYETDCETLLKWVGEGMVQPSDAVKKGSLNWIEAGRAPMLRPAFARAAEGGAQAVAAGHAAPRRPLPESASVQIATLLKEHGIKPREEVPAADAPAGGTQTPALPSVACHFHPQLEARFVCRVCGETFCRECPNFVGTGKVPLCKLCGDLCRPVSEVKERAARQEFQHSGFGLRDFTTALAYPFRNKIGLLCGAAFYGFLLLAGFRGRILGAAILFGCISVVINKVAHGKLDRNFLPDFSSFSPWDDLVRPALLGLCVTVVTIGPVLVLALAFVFGLLTFGAQAPQLPPQIASARNQQEVQLTQEDFDSLARGDDPERDAETAKKLERLRPEYQMAEQARAEEESRGTLAALRQFSGAPVLLLLLLLGGVAWAVFYYPMALAVAGYTEEFSSVLNPLVGINTIRRMGFTYVKAFFMYLGVQLVGICLSLVAAVVTAPFQMPFVGNLPATFLDGMITFYISLVVACLLGLALFKSADRLGINFD